MSDAELAQLKVKYTEWVDPDIDEAKFWQQCANVADIDPNWLKNRLKRGITAVIDKVKDE